MTTHRSFLFRETLYKIFICITERKRKGETDSNDWLVTLAVSFFRIWRYGYSGAKNRIKSVWKGHESQAFYKVFHQWSIRLAQLTHSKVICQGECPRLVHHLCCAKSYDTLIIKVIVWLIDWLRMVLDYAFTSYRFPWVFKKVMFNSRNLITLRGHETYNDISNKIKRPYLRDLKS